MMEERLKQFRGRSPRNPLAVLAAASVIMVVGPIAPTAGASSANARSNNLPITVGVISAANGTSPTTWGPRYQAFVATVNWANANGGVNGHQINLVTQLDASSTTQNLTAAQSLVQNKGALVVVDLSDAMAGGAPWLSQNNVPVVGASAISSAVSQYRTFFTPTGGYNTNPTLWNTDAVRSSSESVRKRWAASPSTMPRPP